MFSRVGHSDLHGQIIDNLQKAQGHCVDAIDRIGGCMQETLREEEVPNE